MTRSAYDQQIVIDLEFSRIPKGHRRQGLKNEIIQIGAVRITDDGKLADSFCCFVKPQFHWDIPHFITQLTGITTADVHDADTLDVALQKFGEWIGPGRTRMVAWSDSDRNQIRKECATKDLPVPAQMTRWLNLQRVYPRIMEVGNGNLMPLHTAADWYGVAMDEELSHGALYDAQVTAQLLLLILSGEYKQHRSVLDNCLVSAEEASQPLTSNLGSRFAGLADLYRQLGETQQKAS